MLPVMQTLPPLLRIILAVLLLAVAMTPVHGQPRLLGTPEQEPTPPPVPDVLTLEPGWWQFIANAEGRDLPRRMGELMDSLEATALSMRVADGQGSGDLLERIRTSLDVYEKLRTQPPLESHPPVRLDGQFSLEQLFAIIQERIATERAVATQAQQVAERETDLTAERRDLDQAYAHYQSLPSGAAERVAQGLEVVALRIAVAVSEGRLSRMRLRLGALKSFLEDLQRQSSYARNHLTAEAEDQESLQTALAQAEERERQAREQIALAQTRQLEAEQGSDLGRLENALRQQELIAAELALALARNDQALIRARMAWTRMQTGESPPDEIESLIVQWRDLVGDFKQKIETWRSGAAAVLLAPPATSDVRGQVEQRRYEERARTTAQSNLTALSELVARIEQLAVVTDLLATDVAMSQGPLRRWWVGVRLFVASIYEDSLRLLNHRLFGIGDTPVTAWGIFRILLILLIAFWISKAIRHALERLGSTRSFMSVSSIYVFGRVLHYLIMVGALFIGLGSLGLDFSNLALIAGALSVGIGFGLQSIVGNFVSGLMLLFERSLKVGDYVELDNGLTGHVREINVRSTRINTNDNIDVLVPNSEFVTHRLANWTLRESIARLHIPFGVSYRSDKEEVRKAALEAADAVEFTLKNMPGKEPEVWLVSFGDRALEFELLVWVSRQGVRRPARVKAAYLWELHTALHRYGIEIPFPQRDLHLKSGLEPWVPEEQRRLTAAADDTGGAP